MQSDRRTGRWLRTCSSVFLAGALLSTTACKDDEEKPPEQTLSVTAEKGLAIVPFELDQTGLTIAEKQRIGQGSYLVNAGGGCQDCHQTPAAGGPPKYLSGGLSFGIGASGEVVYGRNLTPDPDTGMKMTEDEFIQSFRTGADYRSDAAAEQLIVMPWASYRWMSTEDLKSMYAYLKKIPAIKNPIPADIKGAAAAARPVAFPSAYTDGEVSRSLPAESTTDTDNLNTERGLALQTLADPAALTSLSAEDKALYARGSYLVTAVADCNGCHTNPQRDFSPSPTNLKIPVEKFLTGGQVFSTPPGLDAVVKTTRSMTADLLGSTHGIMKDMTYEQFKKIIAEDSYTQGSVTRKVAYPMTDVNQALRNMNESDVKAIFVYLKNQTLRSGAGDKVTQPPARWCVQNADCTGAGETCNTATKECVGSTCAQDSECGACQTCTTNKCAAPLPSSACLRNGI